MMRPIEPAHAFLKKRRRGRPLTCGRATPVNTDCPRAYVDRDSIYKTTREPSVAEQLAEQQPLTRFGRAMKRLGRVERRNGLFQDRLVKELRLAGIRISLSGNYAVGA